MSDSEGRNVRRAIFYPVISIKVLKAGLIFGIVLLACAVFGLSANIERADEGVLQWLFTQAIKIPSVAAMSGDSTQPVVYAVSYAAALLIAPLLALAICLSDVNMTPIQNLARNRTTIQRIIWWMFSVMFIAVFFVLDFKSMEGQLSYKFFRLVSSDRFFLLLWIEGILGTMSVWWMWCLFELSNLLYWRKHEA